MSDDFRRKAEVANLQLEQQRAKVYFVCFFGFSLFGLSDLVGLGRFPLQSRWGCTGNPACQLMESLPRRKW